MREFRGENFAGVGNLIHEFVYDAFNSGRPTSTEIHGICLIVNPKGIDAKTKARYAEQLEWVYNMAINRPEVIGKCPSYTNIVPELQALAEKKLKEFESIDPTDTKAVVCWLTDIWLVLWCHWAWSSERSRQVARKLKASNSRRVQTAAPIGLSPLALRDGDRLIQAAIKLLSDQRKGLLSLDWLKSAQKWRTKYG